ncbi:hypothetical protein PSTT_09232 [Puccinia striiformis]|uniref:Fucosyltransferase n=1 Tax=Puccinia striiformis TaxID=27350 RepID=A0A2S4V9B9_9BASI|nr:hypothetical protein PSTT_09232 [Puccinia striiformis]
MDAYSSTSRIVTARISQNSCRPYASTSTSTRAMTFSTQRFSRNFSPLWFLREFSTYRRTNNYEELAQENAGSSVESFHEKGLAPSTGQEPVTRRRNNFERSRLPASCLVVLLLVTTAVFYTRSAALHIQKIDSGMSAPPIKIHFKEGSLRDNEVECDTPLHIVADEDDAHVVVWPSPTVDISKYDGEKSRRERPGQLQGFWSLESAEYYPLIKRARQQLVMKDPKAFDFEVTYKTSSDFPIPYAYGFIDFRKASLAFEARRQDKIAAAFISNCGPLNNRTQILRNLIDLLPGQIDSFGYCLNNANSDQVIQQFDLNPLIDGQPQHKLSRWEEKMSIIQRYKFTIAFENSNDEDYVTEKYYQALEAGSIPIHLGQTPEQFEKFKPSTNSTLNVADFKTVEALADRIKQIANDRVLYESMLAWKKEQFPERFEEILGYGKLHEACRIAKFLRREWRNPHALNQERYDSFYQRLNITTE